MNNTTEAFVRAKIDKLLTYVGWDLTNRVSVLFEHALPDGALAGDILCDRAGSPMTALNAAFDMKA